MTSKCVMVKGDDVMGGVYSMVECQKGGWDNKLKMLVVIIHMLLTHNLRL